MKHRDRSSASIAWMGVAGLAGVFIRFAPVISGGWCADGPADGASLCGSFERSLAGIDTSIWLWLVSSAIVVAVTVAVLARSDSHGIGTSRHGPQAGPLAGRR